MYRKKKMTLTDKQDSYEVYFLFTCQPGEKTSQESRKDKLTKHLGGMKRNGWE